MKQIKDPGFGYTSKKNAKSILNKDGSSNIIHQNKKFSFQDMYSYLIEISWTRFFLLVVVGYIVLNVLQHPLFERRKDDLYMKAPVSFIKAILGGELMIKSIDGKKVTVKIPSETQTHTQLCLRGMGMPRLKDGNRGNLYLRVVVQTPKNLTMKQKKLLQDALIGT